MASRLTGPARRRSDVGRSRAPAPPADSSTLEPGGHSLRDRTLLRYGVRPLLLAMDVAVFALAVLATGPFRGAHVALVVLTVSLLTSSGLYKSRLSLSALDDLPALVSRPLAAAAVTVSLGLLLEDRGDARLLATAALFAVLLVVGRTMTYAVVRRLRLLGIVAHPTLLLGAGRVGGQIGQLLLDHPEYGLHPVGFLDADPLLGPDERPVPLLGGHEMLASVIVEFGVQDVVIAFGSAPESDMVEIIRTCDRLKAEIFFVPRLFELHAMSREIDQVWGLPLVRLRRAAFRSLTWRLKRLLDIVVSGIALLLLSPVLLVCAIAVRLEGGPGILFGQERVGLDGRPFRVLKFRSLKPVDESESQTRWNISLDDRLGPVGRVLRKTSLDELPQLWNILRGDMSLVGPRPERPHFVEQFTQNFPRYVARHRVPAGLTGYAQVHGLRGDTSIEDRARFDNVYIENWSLWMDIKIMIRTISSMLRGS